MAAVTVEDDEVIFTLRAPEANEVFLVGDFNNWNATLEKMERTGDVFAVRLFMVSGSYRYKFVVDGVWIADPDNPPEGGGNGSPLVLKERSGMLILGDVEGAGTDEGLPRIVPGIRYVGLFLWDHGSTTSEQALDFYVGYEGSKVTTVANFKTIDDSWKIDPIATEIDLNRGFLGLELGRIQWKAFENDTMWTSQDPLRMVGDVGIFRYNAGYERKGFSVETKPILKTTVRAMLTDKIEEGPPGTVQVPAGAFGNFANSTEADTFVYRYAGVFDDEDTWAIDVLFDAGSLRLGFVTRTNRGFNPGLAVTVSRQGQDFGVSAANTRENWSADEFWMGYELADGLWLRGAYGYGRAHIRESFRSYSTVATLEDVGIGSQTLAVDASTPLQTSTRWRGDIRIDDEKLRGAVALEFSEFEFPPVLGPGTRAEISVLTVDGAYSRNDWMVTGRVSYTHREYRDTPTEFDYFTPTRNFWLDYRDQLDVPRMVGFDLKGFTTVELNHAWKAPRAIVKPAPLAASPWTRLSARFVGEKAFGTLRFADLRGVVEYPFLGRFYGQLDARIAWYDKASWGLTSTYFAPYVELGYRTRYVEAGLGFGLDPVVLDPVTNEFGDIGREEFLRQAIPAGLTREQADLLGENLRQFEEILDRFEALGLEVVFRF